MPYTLIGTLSGMGREITCTVSIDDRDWATILNAPSEWPDGEYVVTLADRSIPFSKSYGRWSDASFLNAFERRLRAAKHVDD